MDNPYKGAHTANNRNAGRAILISIVILLLLVGLGYTGFHNYHLYKIGLGNDETAGMVAFIPPILLDGSVIVVLAGMFFWFADPLQRGIALIGGWLLFVVLAANTVIDHNIVSGAGLPRELQLYAKFGVPLVIVAVIVFWKLVLDNDPAKKRHERLHMLAEERDRKLFDAEAEALNSEAVANAYAQHSHQAAIDHAGEVYRLRGATASNQRPAIGFGSKPQASQLSPASQSILDRMAGK